MPKVYVCSKIPEEGLTALRQEGFSVEVNSISDELTKAELIKIVSDYDAVITLVTNKIDSDVIKGASSKLKIISNYGVGYDNIDLTAAKKKNITITNTPGVASESVAEHTFMLILACVKKVVEADKFVRLGKYKRWDPYAFVSPQVWGRTIGIVGLGRIGTFVGYIAANGFKMRILYHDIKQSPDFEMITDAKYSDLDTILEEADYISLHVPLNDKTNHLISSSQFKKMKNTAILINTARGPIVDEKALIIALKNGEIAACGLDVFEYEPQINEELLTMDNVIFTPHSASATVETRVVMSKIAALNIIDVFAKREPKGLVKG